MTTTTHRLGTAYSWAFQTFLECTDEKQIILKQLKDSIQEFGVGSILDIGAGNGDLAIPLSQLVRRYVAIEERKDFADKLRRSGIEVVNSKFPCITGAKFSMVLVCHSLPPHSEGESRWKWFVSEAWRCKAPSGMLSIVTFDDENSEWSRMLQFCGLDKLKPRHPRLKNLRENLRTLGLVQETSRIAFVRSHELHRLIRALAFVWSDGDESLIQEFVTNRDVAGYLKVRYKTSGQYYFPFYHIFFNVLR